MELIYIIIFPVYSKIDDVHLKVYEFYNLPIAICFFLYSLIFLSFLSVVSFFFYFIYTYAHVYSFFLCLIIVFLSFFLSFFFLYLLFFFLSIRPTSNCNGNYLQSCKARIKDEQHVFLNKIAK